MEGDYGVGDNEVKQKAPEERADAITNTIRNFRIAHAGDGLLRGNFGRLPDNFKDLQDQMDQIKDAVSKFQLEGDGLNVSGSFEKGYTVSREFPCEQQTGEVQ